MPVEIVDLYTLGMIRGRPDVLFAFGDNMARAGRGGQAGPCRGEPNAVGIPTKWRPAMDDAAFFSDEDLPKVKDAIDAAFQILRQHLLAGGTVVLPSGGIGTGLARLSSHAPAIHRYIQDRIDLLRVISSPPAP